MEIPFPTASSAGGAGGAVILGALLASRLALPEALLEKDLVHTAEGGGGGGVGTHHHALVQLQDVRGVALLVEAVGHGLHVAGRVLPADDLDVFSGEVGQTVGALVKVLLPAQLLQVLHLLNGFSFSTVSLKVWLEGRVLGEPSTVVVV